MKQLVKWGILSQLFCTPVFALNPVQGFYFGLLGGISHGPSNAPIAFREDGQAFKGTVGYSIVGGGGGIMLGYKYSHLRGEAELLVNRFSTGPVTVGTCIIENEDIGATSGLCPEGTYDHFKSKALGYSGNSTAMYGLVNGIWDFFSSEGQGSSGAAPYLGFGLGMSSVKNGSSFVNTKTQYSHGQTPTSTGPAYQGILGISYYMDDYTWCSMDFRYLSTNIKAETNHDINLNLPSRNYAIQTLNFTFNAAFDKGGITP
jgi:outer membrane protein W